MLVGVDVNAELFIIIVNKHIYHSPNTEHIRIHNVSMMDCTILMSITHILLTQISGKV